MLLLLTAVVGAVLAFVVMPWQHARAQETLWAELQGVKNLEFQPLSQESYRVTIRARTQAEFTNELVEKLNACERIESIHLFLFRRVSDPSYMPLLLALQRLDLLSYKIGSFFDTTVGFDESDATTLAALPLTSLTIRCIAPVNFQTWPLQPKLRHFDFHVDKGQLTPFRLENHQQLTSLILKIDGSAGLERIQVQDCPLLKQAELVFRPADSLPEMHLRLQDLPLLDDLHIQHLSIQQLLVTEIQKLPVLRRALLVNVPWSTLSPDKAQNLRELQVMDFLNKLRPFTRADWQGILKLKSLQELELSLPIDEWPDFANVPVARLSKLHLDSFTTPIPLDVAKQLVRRARSLEKARFHFAEIDAELLELLAGLKLKRLKIMVNSSLPDLVPLTRCQTLEDLQFMPKKISSTELAPLTRLPNLKKLYVKECSDPTQLIGLFQQSALSELIVNEYTLSQVLHHFQR